MKTKKVFAFALIIFSIFLIVVALGIAIHHHQSTIKIEKMEETTSLFNFNQKVGAITLNCEAEKLIEETHGEKEKVFSTLKKWLEIVDENDVYHMELIFNYGNYNLTGTDRDKDFMNLYYQKRFGISYQDKEKEWDEYFEKEKDKFSLK